MGMPASKAVVHSSGVLASFENLAASHKHLISDTPEYRRYVQLANTSALKRGIVSIPSSIPVSLTVSLAQWQTPFKNQLDRGTCYAFASMAALEAAYKRKYAVTLDLSEQYAFHINKACELFSDYVTDGLAYENNSSMWGFQGGSDIVDKLTRFAVPQEADCPYLSGSQMQALLAATPQAGTLSNQEELDAFEFLEGHIPTAARYACKYQVKSAAALPANPSVSDIEAVIGAGHEVVVDIPGHCFLIIGYDRLNQNFIVKNSWGENQFITYPYSKPILGGRYITDVYPLDAPPQKKAFWMGRWNMDHDGWRGTMVIRRWTDFRHGDGDPTKLGNYYRDGKRYDVNGRATEDGQGMAFWIADTTDKVLPGTQEGQPFDMYVFSFEPDRVAGLTLWDNVRFGATMRRDAIPVQPRIQAFDESEWVGNWQMDHDGWIGQLDIWTIRPFSGKYTGADGQVYPVTGARDPIHPHILNISIAFSADNQQPFQLAHYTWEKKMFSGVTNWAGITFGVFGTREINLHSAITGIEANRKRTLGSSALRNKVTPQ